MPDGHVLPLIENGRLLRKKQAARGDSQAASNLLGSPTPLEKCAVAFLSNDSDHNQTES
ncbi:hypothetical protein EMIT0P265_180009 [Pseudomonas zeae]